MNSIGRARKEKMTCIFDAFVALTGTRRGISEVVTIFMSLKKYLILIIIEKDIEGLWYHEH